MSDKLTLEQLEQRLFALETAVASLTAEKSKVGAHEVPSGKFAHLGGIERRGPTTHEAREVPIDFSRVGGRKIG